MHCPVCGRAMVSTCSQTFEDERETMTITRWRCRPCHETAEEIWISAGDCWADPRQIRYAVAEQPSTQVLALARAGTKRRAQVYASAI